MSLNYGLGENFNTLVPVANGICIFDAISHNIQIQYPMPPNHSVLYSSISLISAESVILISSHNCKSALPETDDGVIEYHISTYDSVDGSRTDTKIAEYRPKLAVGTTYHYDVNTKARVGDFLPQSKIDGSSAFIMSVRRKEDNGQPGIGTASNEMFYTIMSPTSMFL